MSWEVISSNTVVTEVLARKVKTTAGDSLYLHKRFVNDKCTGYWFGKFKREYDYKVHYQYATHEFLELIKNKSFGSMDSKDYEMRWEDLASSDANVFDVSRICRWQAESHLVFQYGKKAPISSVYNFDYVFGISDKYFDVDKCYEHLKNHPNVLKCEIEDIPYYNKDENFTRGIKMSILLPQETTDVMWDFCKDKQYPSVRFEESIIGRYGNTSTLDPLGVQQFRVENND